jgi:transcriptional regulator PpsR
VTSRGTKYWNSGAIPLIAPELLGDIISMASDLSIAIARDATVLSVMFNPASTQFAPTTNWEGKNLRQFLTSESKEKLDKKLALFADGNQSPQTVELNHSDDTRWEFPIRYSFHPIGADGSLLMLGRDLRPIAEMQQQLVKAQLALERDYEVQREFDTRYRVLMENSREALVFVAIATGRIVDANSAAAQILGTTRDTLPGTAFAGEFDGKRRGELLEMLTNSAISETERPVQLSTKRGRRMVGVTSRMFRAAGERLLLCRLDQAGAPDAAGDALSENLSALYQEGVDAIVFTDIQGDILSANESFLNLVDSANLTAVRGKSFGQFMSRGMVDLKVLIDNVARAGRMRLYATKLQGEYGSQLPVEISATYLNDRTNPVVVFVIRDSSRAEAMRSPGAGSGVSDGAVKSVMELVGTATLKDIVAETTDVVEKMCIETAVELTRNNRVAAAEMLGLSRQSLYVKLRKYGLLSKNGE